MPVNDCAIMILALKDAHNLGNAHGGISMINVWTRLNLCLFDGGAAAGGEGGGATGGGNQGTVAASQRADKNALANVKYGIQESETADAAQAGAAPERNLQQEWQKMINGEFKEFYTRDTQNMINKRFRESKEAQETSKKYQDLAEKVGARFAVDPQNVDALLAAIDGDKGFLQEQADKMGMTLERYTEWAQNKQAAQRYEQLMSRQRQEAEEARRVADWENQAEAMRGKYGDAFDLDADLANTHFRDMLRSGVSMEHAWKMLHFDELMEKQAAFSAEMARKQVVDQIQARGMRPTEGAAGRTPAVVHKPNVKELNKKDREEINRRVMAGEKISFG